MAPTTAVDFTQLDNVQPGDKVTIRFKPEATDDVVYVLAMRRASVLELKPGDVMLLEAVRMTDDWDHDSNRTMTLTAGPRWNSDFFVGRMRRAIESLEVKPTH